MLGKLTKHELIASGRMILPMYIALICTSLVSKFFIWISSKKSFIDSAPLTFSKIVTSISSLFTILNIILIFVVLIGTIIFLLVRFYKNYYTDEGYLMFTLPVSSTSLIFSKLLSALVWTIVSSAISLGAFLFIMHTEETANSFGSFWDELGNLLHRMAVEMDIPFGLLVTEFILLIMITIIGKYLMFYTSISIGPSIMSRNKVVGSIIGYVIVYIATQIVSFLVLYLLSSVMPNYIDALSQNAGQAVQSTILTVSIVNLVYCVVFFFITHHLMKTKTNLD